MFTQEQIEAMPISIYKRIRDINTGYLEMIGKRIAEAGETIPSDVMKLQRIYESGTDVREIEWALAEASKKNIKEIKSILSDIAKENYEFSEPFYKAKRKKFIPFEDNESIQRHIEAIARQTVKEYTGLAASAAFLAFDKNGNIPNKFGNLKAVPTSLYETYKIVTDKAIEAVSMGYTDYNTAMRRTLKALADSGIRDTVTYSTGYTRRLDTAVRQNILWGIKQCNQETADIIGEEIGADGYEISYHSNPRPTHEEMGGRQYAVGKARTINGVYYPSFSEVEGLLNDYGCLHFKFSIVLGISRPAYSNKKLAELKAKDREPITFEGNEITKYDASQMQRKLETAMRHTNDRITIATAAHNEDMLNKEIERMRQLTRKYKELSNASGLPTKMERTVSGFGAKTSRKTLTNGENGGIIKEQNRKNITVITDKAIEKVPKVEISGYSNEQNALIQQQHKELLRYAKDNNDSKEVAFVFDKGLINRTEYVGNDNSLDFGTSLFGKGNDLLIMHNHPRNSSYSYQDIFEFVNADSIKTLTIVKNNGNVETLVKLDAYDKKTAVIERERHKKKYIVNGTDDEYNILIDKMLNKLGKRGMVEWTR